MLTDFDHKLAILNHLKAVMELDGSNPSGELLYKFKGDWNDQKVGEKFGYDATQIARFRQARGMELNQKSVPRPNNFSPIRLEFNRLMARFDQLEDRVTEMDSKNARLFAEIDREGARRMQELTALGQELRALRDEVGRLRTAHNAHAQAINALEEATTKPKSPIKSFADIKR